MKFAYVIIICLFALYNIYAAYQMPSKEYLEATKSGADIKCVFRVVDDNGNPVSNAYVGVSFYMHKRWDNPSVKGFTDSNGYFTAMGKGVGEVTYTIRKEGFYETRSRILLYGSRFNRGEVKDGKWQPYGKVYEVILKPYKHPGEMKKYSFGGYAPPLNKPHGFDLQIGDWVEPNGKGKVSDFTVTLTGKVVSMWHYHIIMTVSFTNALDGAYLKKKDIVSEFKSEYRANTNAVFQKEFVFEVNALAKRAYDHTKTILQESEYLVLRTRTKLDEKGNLIEAYYSKIYGPWRFVSKNMPLSITANIRPNEINLESKEKADRSVRCYERWKKSQK